MVKRLRDQSAEKPRRRICPRMVWPVVSYHWFTRRSQASYQRCSTTFGSYRVSTVGTVYVLSLPRLRGRAGWGPLQRRLARRVGSRAVFGVGYRRLLDAGRFRELGQEDGRAHRQQRFGDDFVHGLDELERQPLADVGWDVSQIGLVVGR